MGLSLREPLAPKTIVKEANHYENLKGKAIADVLEYEANPQQRNIMFLEKRNQAIVQQVRSYQDILAIVKAS